MSGDHVPRAEDSGAEIADFTTAPAAGCTVLSIAGTKLTVESPRDFPLSAAVKVTGQNRMWIGEVWACEPAPQGFLLEIEVDARLNDVQGVSELAARFRHERTIRTGPGDATAPRTGATRDLPE